MSDETIFEKVYKNQHKNFYEDLHRLICHVFEMIEIADVRFPEEESYYKTTLKLMLSNTDISKAMKQAVDKEVMQRMGDLLEKKGLDGWIEDDGECLSGIDHLPRTWKGETTISDLLKLMRERGINRLETKFSNKQA